MPTYQGRASLPAIVEPLLSQQALYELVIVVDGSTDGSAEWLRDRASHDKRLRVIERPNGGQSAARQTGLEQATGEVVLFLDDDLTPDLNLIEGHARYYIEDKHILVQGYYPNDWRGLPPDRRAIGLIYQRIYEAACRRHEEEPEQVLLGLWGGHFSLRRDDCRKVGGMITHLPRALLRSRVVPRMVDRHEDREFGLRCWRLGLQGIFDRQLRAYHRYDRDLAGFRRDSRASGTSLSILHYLHSDLVGEELNATVDTLHSIYEPGQSLPPMLRPLVLIFARDPLFPVVTATLTAVFWISIQLRLFSLQLLSARGLGLLETQRGVLDFHRLSALG